MIDTIIFDIDGTLIDTEYAYMKGLQEYLSEEKGVQLPYETLRTIFGIPGREGLRQLGFPQKEVADMHLGWQRYAKRYYQQIEVFPQISEVLTQLQAAGLSLGVVTSKTDATLATTFTPYGLNHFFECLVTSDRTLRHKPHPEPLLYFLEQTGKQASQCVYVGDTRYDNDSAHAAGMKFALATWGANPKVQFDADFTLVQTTDLLTFLSSQSGE